MDLTIIVLVILAFFCPPIAVLATQGIGFHLILNIVLTVLYWFPGVIHALYCIAITH